jgi:hypothetical protein
LDSEETIAELQNLKIEEVGTNADAAAEGGPPPRKSGE